MTEIDRTKNGAEPIPVVDKLAAQKIEDAGAMSSAQSHLLREAAELVATKLQKSDERQEARFWWMCVILGTMCFISTISAIYAGIASERTRTTIETVAEETGIVEPKGEK